MASTILLEHDYANMTETHARRMLYLAKFMAKLPKSKLNLSHFCARYHKCGTTACVVGWAGSLRPFQRLGLKWDPLVHDAEGYVVSGDNRVDFVPKTDLDKIYAKFYEQETGEKPYGSVDAGGVFFGLTQDEAHNLFANYGEYEQGSDDDITPKQIARVLTAIVKKNFPHLLRK